jgi:hypothetical protein
MMTAIRNEYNTAFGYFFKTKLGQEFFTDNLNHFIGSRRVHETKARDGGRSEKTY